MAQVIAVGRSDGAPITIDVPAGARYVVITASGDEMRQLANQMHREVAITVTPGPVAQRAGVVKPRMHSRVPSLYDVGLAKALTVRLVDMERERGGDYYRDEAEGLFVELRQLSLHWACEIHDGVRDVPGFGATPDEAASDALASYSVHTGRAA